MGKIFKQRMIRQAIFSLLFVLAFQAAYGQLCSENRLLKVSQCMSNVVTLDLNLSHDRQAHILRLMDERCKKATLIEDMCGDCAPPVVAEFEKALCHEGKLTKPAYEVYECLSYVDANRLKKQAARAKCEHDAYCPFCLYEVMANYCRIPEHFKAYWEGQMGSYELKQISDRIFGVCKVMALETSIGGVPLVPNVPVDPSLPEASTGRPSGHSTRKVKPSTEQPDYTAPRVPDESVCRGVSRRANLDCLRDSMVWRNRSDVVEFTNYVAGPWAVEKMFTQWCRAKLDLHEDCPCAARVLRFLEVICEGEELSRTALSVLECHQAFTPRINQTVQRQCPEAFSHQDFNCSKALDQISCVRDVHFRFCGPRVTNNMMALFQRAIQLHTRLPVYPDYTSMCTSKEFNERFSDPATNDRMMTYILIGGGVIYCISICLLGLIFGICLWQNTGKTKTEKTRRPSSGSADED